MFAFCCRRILEILKQHLKISAGKLKLGHKWVFQMDSDSKGSTEIVMKSFKDNKVVFWGGHHKVLISALKKKAKLKRFTNWIQSHQFCLEDWDKILTSDCEERIYLNILEACHVVS